MNHLAGDLSGPEPSSSSLRYQAEAGREMSVDHIQIFMQQFVKILYHSDYKKFNPNIYATICKIYPFFMNCCINILNTLYVIRVS